MERYLPIKENMNSHELLDVVLMLSIMAFIAQFSYEGYLTSFSAISKEFSVDHKHIQLSMSIYLFGISLSQIFYGVISDIYGRKKILLLGYIIFLLGSMIAALALSFNSLFIGRFIQGIGIGSSGVLRFAILRDRFSGEKFSQAFSYVSSMSVFFLPLIVIFTGYTQKFFGWRFNFIFVAVITLIFSLLFNFYFFETPKIKPIKKMDIKKIMKIYLLILSNPNFTIRITCGSLTKSIMILYTIVSAFLFQNVFNLSAVSYGWISAINVVAFAIGGTINGILVRTYGIKLMVFLGVALTLCGSIIMFILGVMGYFHPLSIIIPSFLVFLGGRIQYTNICAEAFDFVPNIVGAASAVCSIIEVGITSAFSLFALIVSSRYSQIPLSILLTVLSFIIILCLRSVNKYFSQVGSLPLG